AGARLDGEEALRRDGRDGRIAGEGRQQARELRRQEGEGAVADRARAGVADALVRDEEEGAILAFPPVGAALAEVRRVDGAAEGAAEDVEETLVRLGLPRALLDVVKAVQVRVVAMELEGRAVKLVR